jgi:hypothetical protein
MKRPVPHVVPARATGPQVQGRAGPGRSRRSETPQDDYNNSRACAKGSGPCGGRPLRRLRATPPLSGEARPKSRLRRLAVGGCWRSPLEGRLAGFGWCLPEERALRGNPSVACGRHLPFQGRHGLRAAYGGWPWGLLRSPLVERFLGASSAALGGRLPDIAWRFGETIPQFGLPSYQAVRPRFLTAAFW